VSEVRFAAPTRSIVLDSRSQATVGPYMPDPAAREAFRVRTKEEPSAREIAFHRPKTETSDAEYLPTLKLQRAKHLQSLVTST